MTSYSVTVDDAIGLHQADGAFGYGSTLTDVEKLTDGYGPILVGVNLTGGLGIAEPFLAYSYSAGAVIDEIIRVNGRLIAGAVYSPTLVDTIHLVDQLFRAMPVTVTENMNVVDAMTIGRGVVLLEKIGFDEAFVINRFMNLSLADAIKFADSINDFFGRGGDDAIGFTDAFDAQFVFNRIVSENVEIASTVSANTLFMRVVDDDIGYDDNIVIQSIFNSAIIDDYINFSIATLDPGGDFTTWVINTRTQAVTEYSNYNFNSFLQIGNEYYGCNDDGIWLLNAQTDNGINIVADIKGAMLSFGGSRFTQLDGVYLGIRTDTNARDWVLKLIAPNAGTNGTDATFYYSFRPRDMETTRVTIGKGFRYRYFQWELITSGEDFDLDSIEFVPIISKRRVR